MWKRCLAEFAGTLALVLVGCGAIAVGGFWSAAPMGFLPVALAFGLTMAAMVYALGPVSGCHLNPAVTLAMWVAGRMRTRVVPGYIAAQMLGGISGAGLLATILHSRLAGYDIGAAGMGQNGWGPGHLGGYGLTGAIVVEFVATLVLAVVALCVTSRAGATPLAGLAIGLTLAALHIPFANVTGLSANPARSFGPAMYVGGHALAQIWLFLLVPAAAGLVAGLLSKKKVFEA